MIGVEGREMYNYKNLGYAIIEQAVEDYNLLTLAGLIITGDVIKKWPVWKKRTVKECNYYDNKAKVVELIYWFKSGAFNEMLEWLNSEINGNMALETLGLIVKEQKTNGGLIIKNTEKGEN